MYSLQRSMNSAILKTWVRLSTISVQLSSASRGTVWGWIGVEIWIGLGLGWVWVWVWFGFGVGVGREQRQLQESRAALQASNHRIPQPIPTRTAPPKYKPHLHPGRALPAVRLDHPDALAGRAAVLLQDAVVLFSVFLGGVLREDGLCNGAG
jgi:hypothetical protein